MTYHFKTKGCVHCMHKQFWSERCTLLFLTVIIFSLTACSGFPFSAMTSSPTATPTPHVTKYVLDTVDSCSLVTKAQIEQIIKAPVTVQEPDKINGRYGINTCNYNLQGGGVVNVDLNVSQDAASAKNALSSFIAKDSAMSPKPIGGLGDQAFVEQQPFSIVDVLQDNAILTVGVGIMMDDAIRKNEEIQIARIALQSL